MQRFRSPLDPPFEDRGGAPARHAAPTAGQGPFPSSMGTMGFEFLAKFLRAELERRPENRGALTSLSQCLSKLGRHEEGCSINQRLVQLMPEHPVAFYNWACSLAMLGNEAQALRALQQAVDFGFSDANYLEKDPDLASLRETPPFRILIETLRKGTHRA